MSELAVDAQNLTRSFGSGTRAVHALRGVDLHVPTGALVMLMGPSGSGKTTLLNLIGGLDQPSGGTLSVMGRQFGRLGAGALAAERRRIGYIFQSFALVATATATENIELGLRIAGNTPRTEWDERVRRVLAAVGMLEWAQHRPYELSGGQQQRIAIARALATRPPLILADEPTGDLDSNTGRRILELFRALADREGTTIVMTTHDPTATAYATDVHRMQDGQFIT